MVFSATGTVDHDAASTVPAFRAGIASGPLGKVRTSASVSFFGVFLAGRALLDADDVPSRSSVELMSDALRDHDRLLARRSRDW